MEEEFNIVGAGNTKIDQAWLLAVAEAGELDAVDPEGLEPLPYGAAIRFNGDPDVSGSPYFLPPEGTRCRGTAYVRAGDGSYVITTEGKRLRRPCRNWPVAGGSGVCLIHGGGTQTAIAAAKMRLLSSADAVVGMLVKIALDKKMDAKVRVAACNSILDRIGVRAGVNVTVEAKPWQDLLKRLDADGSLSAAAPDEEGEGDDGS